MVGSTLQEKHWRSNVLLLLSRMATSVPRRDQVMTVSEARGASRAATCQPSMFMSDAENVLCRSRCLEAPKKCVRGLWKMLAELVLTAQHVGERGDDLLHSGIPARTQ